MSYNQRKQNGVDVATEFWTKPRNKYGCLVLQLLFAVFVIASCYMIDG